MKEKIMLAIMQIQGFQVFMYLVFGVSRPGMIIGETFTKQEVRRYAVIALTPIALSIFVSFAFPLTLAAVIGGIVFFAWAFILFVCALAGRRAVEYFMDGGK